MERGQIVVRPAEEAYVATGRFDPDQILGLFATDIDLALVQGYAGVRATGEATWTLRGRPGTERFVEFEQKVDDAFRTSEINAMSICQYDRRWFSVKPLETLLHTHMAQVRVDDVYNDGILRIAPTWTPPGLPLHGAIEESTFLGLTEALSTIGEKTGHICLELSGVEFCDMAGLRTLLGANTSDNGFERSLLLRNCPQHIRGLLKLACWEGIPSVFVEES
jgi:anti-anti-sigma regulatory factor